MNQQPLWLEQQQPHYPRKMPHLYNWYTLSGLLALYITPCVLFGIVNEQMGSVDLSQEPALYQNMTSVGVILLLGLHGLIILLDAHNFFTLNGKIRWHSLKPWARLGLGFAYCGFWVMPAIYLVLAIKYRWQIKHPGKVLPSQTVNSYVTYPQTPYSPQIPPPPPPPLPYDGAQYPQPIAIAVEKVQIPYYQPYPVSLPLPRNKVFISYSHKDTKYLQRLQTHFAHYERMGIVDVWNDTKLAHGALWHEEIRKATAQTKVAVLLVSADYLASQFIVEKELPPLLRAAQTEGAIIIPVILSACAFDASALAQFQAVNNPKKPVSSMNWDETEKLWATIAKIVSKAVNTQQTPQEVRQNFPWTSKNS